MWIKRTYAGTEIMMDWKEEVKETFCMTLLSTYVTVVSLILISSLPYRIIRTIWNRYRNEVPKSDDPSVN